MGACEMGEWIGIAIALVGLVGTLLWAMGGLTKVIDTFEGKGD